MALSDQAKPAEKFKDKGDSMALFDEVKPESRFVEDLGADSLDVVEMIMALEEKFEIEIPDSEAENIKTVQDVVDYIEKHK